MDSVLNLKVAFPYALPAKEYDPARIYLTPEYTFLEHIYSPLIKMGKDGQLLSGVAEKYQWVGSEAHLSIRSDLKTIDGFPITAHDAALSLKRLIILTGNTHGNIKSMLCQNENIRSLSDDCSGIITVGNTLILRPMGDSARRNKQFLFPMLTAIDFAVIPSNSIDYKTLSIKDYRNTSGPYFVYQDSPGGHIIWNANPYHFEFSKDMPQSIQLVPSDSTKPRDSIDKFKNGEIDVISTDDKAPIEETIAFGNENPDAELHVTMKIRTHVILFTNNGRKKLSSKERFSIGKTLKSVFVEEFGSRVGHEETLQFFPVFGEGGLNQEQIAELNQLYDGILSVKSGNGLRIRFVYMREPEKMKAIILRKLPGVIIEEGQSTAFEEKVGEGGVPDIEISGRDTGFLEDIGLLSFAMAGGYFGLNKDEIERWQNDYMGTEEKENRIKKMRELHFRALMEPVMVPMLSSSYVAVARKPWKLHFPTLYSNTQYWMMRRNR